MRAERQDLFLRDARSGPAEGSSHAVVAPPRIMVVRVRLPTLNQRYALSSILHDHSLTFVAELQGITRSCDSTGTGPVLAPICQSRNTLDRVNGYQGHSAGDLECWEPSNLPREQTPRKEERISGHSGATGRDAASSRILVGVIRGQAVHGLCRPSPDGFIYPILQATDASR